MLSVRLAPVLAAAAVLLGGIAVSAPLWACTAPLVCKPKLSLVAGAQIPANAKGIPVLLPTPLQPPYQPVVPQLLNSAGQPVAVDLLDDAIGWTLVKPVKGFEVGSLYTLRLATLCKDAEGALLPPDDITLTASAAAPLPTELGVLQLTAMPAELVSVWTTTGSCTEAILAVRGRIAVQATAALAPWKALARTEVKIDGAPWAQSGYGDLPLADERTPAKLMGRTIHAFHAGCGPISSSADKGLPVGLHHVELRIHVAGEASDAPDLQGDLQLQCPASPDKDTISGTDATADAGKDATPGPVATASLEGGGGSCGAAQSAGLGWWAGAAGLALVVAWRRRMRGPAAYSPLLPEGSDRPRPYRR